ncbi:hypothetical protein [Catenulispora rubra]|uniref:hypothetical protein n=1 Tax=Catenulispora rubra TaxID=280293 RepID=UPI001891FE4B|nr:hypothetical protein [Catenulispora rubra]
MCVVTFGVLLYSVRGLDFFYDEWDFVDKAEGWHFSDYFVPHQEHWSTVPMVIYRVLLGLNGMHSYLPFSATLLALHCANAFLLFSIIRRRSGDALGIAAAAILLVLGRGSDDFIWAFQIGFSCSVFFGLIAVLLVDAERLTQRALAGGSAALVLSLASSGEGLFFTGAVGVLLVVRSGAERGDGAEAPWWRPARFRTAAMVLAAPVVAYGIWYPLYGARHADIARSPLSLTAASGLLSFVPTGLGSGMAGLLGAGWRQWWIGFAVFVLLFVLVCRRGRPAALAIALGAGAIAQYSMTGLVRAQFGTQLAGASRYVYIAAVFLLPIVAEAVRDVRWEARWRAVAVGVAVVACGAGTLSLSTAIDRRDRQFVRQKAMLQTVWYDRGDARLDPNAVIDPADAPTLTVGLYIRTRAELGSPLSDLDAKGLAALNADAVAEARRNVLRGGGQAQSGTEALAR